MAKENDDMVGIEEELASLSLSKKPAVILKTKFLRCPVCWVGEMEDVKREKSEMLIYGRNGVQLAEHKEHRWSNNKLASSKLR